MSLAQALSGKYCEVNNIGNRDFKIKDATASRTRWLINGLGLEGRRLRGKSKVKIPVWMQDNAAAKRSLSESVILRDFFRRNSRGII